LWLSVILVVPLDCGVSEVQVLAFKGVSGVGSVGGAGNYASMVSVSVASKHGVLDVISWPFPVVHDRSDRRTRLEETLDTPLLLQFEPV